LPESRVAEKQRMINRIMEAQQQMYHVLALDRSDPLLAVHLTMSQLKLLLILSLRPGASGQDLTAALGVSLATITGIVDRLSAQGLVTRREDDRDRRIRRIDLTPSGHQMIEDIITAGAAHTRRLLQRLDTGELALVEGALGALLRAAEAERIEHGGQLDPAWPTGAAAEHPA
jgi:DNA-binding MarR family transcriptional regulator